MAGGILSCSDAIAKALRKNTMQNPEKGNGNGHKKGHHEVCSWAPVLNAVARWEHEGGCAVCHNCGFTKCGKEST